MSLASRQATSTKCPSTTEISRCCRSSMRGIRRIAKHPLLLLNRAVGRKDVRKPAQNLRSRRDEPGNRRRHLSVNYKDLESKWRRYFFCLQRQLLLCISTASSCFESVQNKTHIVHTLVESRSNFQRAIWDFGSSWACTCIPSLWPCTATVDRQIFHYLIESLITSISCLPTIKSWHLQDICQSAYCNEIVLEDNKTWQVPSGKLSLTSIGTSHPLFTQAGSPRVVACWVIIILNLREATTATTRSDVLLEKRVSSRSA
jgi:hypothetical protein